MGRFTKIALISAAVLLIAGIIVAGGALASVSFDFTAVNTENFTERYFEINEQITAFDIDAENFDVWLTESPDGKCYVTAPVSEYTTTQVDVKNGTLVIKRIDTRKWYEYISIVTINPELKILICVPSTEFKSLDLSTTSGDVDIPVEFMFETVDISTTSGDINSKAVVNTEAEFSSTSGSINIQNLNANKASVGSTSGNINIEVSEPQKLDVHSTSGRIYMKKIKVTQEFEIESTSGDAELEFVVGMKMKRDSTSGDTKMMSVWMQELIDINATSGDIRLNGSDAVNFKVNTTSGSVSGSILTPKIFVTNTTSGNVNIREAQADQSKVYGAGRFEATTTSGNIDIVMAIIDENLLFTDLDSIIIVK